MADTPTAAITASIPELRFTCPDEPALARLARAAAAVSQGAALARSTVAPWQLRVTRRPETADADWRRTLITLIELS